MSFTDNFPKHNNPTEKFFFEYNNSLQTYNHDPEVDFHIPDFTDPKRNSTFKYSDYPNEDLPKSKSELEDFSKRFDPRLRLSSGSPAWWTWGRTALTQEYFFDNEQDTYVESQAIWRGLFVRQWSANRVTNYYQNLLTEAEAYLSSRCSCPEKWTSLGASYSKFSKSWALYVPPSEHGTVYAKLEQAALHHPQCWLAKNCDEENDPEQFLPLN